MDRDPADAVAGAPHIERAVDVARLDWQAVPRGEYELVFLAANAHLWPVVGAHCVLVPLGDSQRGYRDRRKRVGAAIGLEYLLMGKRVTTNAL